jgi:hypothetical protein
MFSRLPRWTWLALFVTCNLVFWVAMAVGVGVLASNKVNLGVESFLRAQQATAIAAWGEASLKPVQITALPAKAKATLPTEAEVTLPRVAGAIGSATEEAALPATTEATSPTRTETAAPLARTHVTATPTNVQGAAAPAKTWASTTPAPAQQASHPTQTPTVKVDASREPLPATDIPPAREPRVPDTTPTAMPTALPTSSRVAGPPVSLTVVASSNPLLVSDPDLSGLAVIDAEMNRSAAGRPVQIRYGEEALNQVLTAAVADDPELPYRNLHVDLKRDGILLNGTITVMGFEVKTEVEGSVVARDCVPQTEIQRIAIAGLVTPAFVRDNIRGIVEESLNWYPADYPLCLERIVLEEDRVTIYGSRR